MTLSCVTVEELEQLYQEISRPILTIDEEILLFTLENNSRYQIYLDKTEGVITINLMIDSVKKETHTIYDYKMLCGYYAELSNQISQYLLAEEHYVCGG